MIFEPLGLGQTIKACLGLEAALQLVLGSERGREQHRRPWSAPKNVAGEPLLQEGTAAAAGLAHGSLGAGDGTLLALLAQPSIPGAVLGGWMRGCWHAARSIPGAKRLQFAQDPPKILACSLGAVALFPCSPGASRTAGGTPSAAKHEARAQGRAWGTLNSGSPGPRAG